MSENLTTSSFENKEEIEYKNLHLFYKNLYNRLFNMIHLLIDEKHFNIKKIKNEVISFTDDYSYYIIGKPIIFKKTKKESHLTDKEVLQNIKNHDDFTSKLKSYPTQEYSKYRKELKKESYKIYRIGNDKYNYLVNEYYSFFDEVLNIVQEFIRAASENGFLPILKSKKSLRSIGYANYDTFFQELENLRIKMSDITKDINFTNLLKVRRSIYILLVVFSPYFKRNEIKQDLLNILDFEFIKNKENTQLMLRISDIDSIYDLTSENREKITTIIKPLKKNISYIKRYISYEFGELDMSPKLKNKYAYDPFWT